MKYNIEDLKANWQSYPNVRARFSEGETGWAKQVSAEHIAIANIPLESRLHCMDVVEATQGADGFLVCGTLIFRTYAKKTGIEYPPGDTKLWKSIVHAAQEAGLIVEGWATGKGAANHHTATDLRDALKSAGVPLDKIRFRTDM